MAYKKYIKKDGKLYGPYVYQSRRVDGKVVSEYCGTDKPNYKKIMFFIFGILILIALVSSFFIFKGKLTGNVISDNQLSSQTENTLISETETISYPIVYFTLISKQTEKSSDTVPIPEKETAPTEQPPVSQEENANTTIPVNNDSLINNNLEMPINDTIDSSNSETTETIVPPVQLIEPAVSETTELVPKEELKTDILEEKPVKETPTEPVPVEVQQEPSATITGGVISRMLGAVSNFFLGLKLTGNAVSESNLKEINGQVSVNEPFPYKLNKGEDIQILSGSVKTSSKLLSDDSIKIIYQNETILVTTDYSEVVSPDLEAKSKPVLNKPKENATNLEVIESTIALTEQEKQTLSTQFKNISVQTIKSELFNGRYIIGYEFGGYKIEYSYDADLSEAILKSQMEKDRVRWLKNIADKILENESIHEEAKQFISNFSL